MLVAGPPGLAARRRAARSSRAPATPPRSRSGRDASPTANWCVARSARSAWPASPHAWPPMTRASRTTRAAGRRAVRGSRPRRAGGHARRLDHGCGPRDEPPAEDLHRARRRRPLAESRARQPVRATAHARSSTRSSTARPRWRTSRRRARDAARHDRLSRRSTRPARRRRVQAPTRLLGGWNARLRLVSTRRDPRLLAHAAQRHPRRAIRMPPIVASPTPWCAAAHELAAGLRRMRTFACWDAASPCRGLQPLLLRSRRRDADRPAAAPCRCTASPPARSGSAAAPRRC